MTTASDDAGGSTVASWWSFYDSDTGAFQYAVIVMGIVGAAANALILYAMVAAKQHKKQFLIFNQNAFDLCSSLLLVITYTIQMCKIRLTGTLVYFVCIMFLTKSLLWCSIIGSTINLLSITVERYIKVVHPNRSKELLRKWVRWSAAAFAWIGAIVYEMALVISTSNLSDKRCIAYRMWLSETAALVHGFWNFGSFYAIVIFIFLFCYGKILVVIRRQARVMAGHSGPGSSTSKTQSSHIQSNVIKTMIIVSALYVILWTPNYIYFLLLHFKTDLIVTVHHIGTFLGFFYISANPFIYALKFHPVRRILVGLIPWKRSEEASG